LPEHLNQPREAPAETRPASAVQFDLIAQLVDLDAEAVEFDFVLPVVASRHRRGPLGMAGWMNLKNTPQILDGPGAPRCQVIVLRLPNANLH
jgi:hypothetical protein